MRVRALTANYDYAFGQSQNNFLVNSAQAVAQIVETNFNLWLGEWYLDVTQGMPWTEGVVDAKVSQAEADATVQAYLANIPNVTDISDFSSTDDQSDRLYSATASIDTPYGSEDIEINQPTTTPG